MPVLETTKHLRGEGSGSHVFESGFRPAHRGYNIGLAGCGMGHKIDAGCGIREILRAEEGMKIPWRDRDALIFIAGMWDSFEILGGTRDLKSK